jgi:LemA protein
MSLLAWTALAAILGCWALGAYNRLVALRGTLVVAWAAIEALVREREALLLPLVQRLRGPLVEQAGALDTLEDVLAQVRTSFAALQGKPFRPAALAVYSAYELDLFEAWAHVGALVDSAGSLAAELSPTLGDVQRLDQRMTAARMAFDAAAAAHDAALVQFPTRLLRPWFGFARVGPL